MRMRVLKTIKATVVILFGVYALAICQGRISVESRVDKSKILIGDVIRYSVIITHDKDVNLKTPPLAVNLGMFEIQDYTVQEIVETDSAQIREQIDYDISTFDTGDYQIPAVEFQYTIGQDTTLYSLETEPIDITVESLNPDKAGDIRDIKVPLVPPRNNLFWYLIAGGAVLLLAAGGFAFYLFKRRRGEPVIPRRQSPPRPAHQVALQALEELAASDLLQRKESKAYYSRLSDILRVYLEGRYLIDAMEMTSEEIYNNLRARKIASDHLDHLHTILSLSDFVKFAKYIPSRKENESSIALAFDFVDQTKLVFNQQSQPSHSTKESGDESKAVQHEAEEKIKEREDG